MSPNLASQPDIAELKKALALMRDGRFGEVDWPSLEVWFQFPSSEQMHRLLKHSDVDWLKGLARSKDLPNNARGFGVRGLAHIASADDVLEFLKDLDRTAEDSGDTGFRLEFIVWRLTDYPDVDESWHRRLYAVVRDNFDIFLAGFTFFVGGDNTRALDAVRQRLSDPRFPPSKNWLYLCGASAQPDPEAVGELLQAYLADPNCDAFSREVAGDLVKWNEMRRP